MRKLKVLELFSGTRSIGKAFEAHGHEVYSVDWDKKFKAHWYVDVESVRPQDILKRFGRPDVIWASPDCSSYSLAAISKHRKLDKELGGGLPLTEYAKKCDRTNVQLIRLLTALKPEVWFIENPRGMLCKMPWMQWAPKYLVTYCSYTQDLPIEQRRMKPTHVFTNVPNPGFKPACKNGDPCHVRAPRGARTGTQGLSKVDRARIPEHLCEHIVEITEDYIERLDLANEYLASLGRKPITPTLEE